MSTIVDVPGHGEVEFPDSMKDEEIVAAIKKLSGPAGAPPRQVGKAEALLRGVTQGATLGFGDEVEAGWKHLVGGADYKSTRDQLRKDEGQAKDQHPAAYLGGEVAGGAAPGVAAMLLTGGVALPAAIASKAPLVLSAGQGALQGAGYSDASDARGIARDSAVGGGVGVLGFGAGKVLGSATSRLSQLARGGSARATAAASQKAADEVAAEIASARGALGSEVQKGSRLTENLRRIGTPLTPEAEAAAQDLERRVGASNLQSLPDQASAIAAKDADLQALKQGASGALKDRTAEMLSSGEARSQLLARLKRYGPPMAGSAIGSYIGGPVGGAIGAAAGAGTRPAIQSLMRLAKSPAVQKAAFDALATGAESSPAEALRQLLSRGGAAAATQSLVGQ